MVRQPLRYDSGKKLNVVFIYILYLLILAFGSFGSAFPCPAVVHFVGCLEEYDRPVAATESAGTPFQTFQNVDHAAFIDDEVIVFEPVPLKCVDNRSRLERGVKKRGAKPLSKMLSPFHAS